jgi:dienelactone hydrolase
MRAVATTFLVAALLWAPCAQAATAALPRPVTITFASQTPGLQLSGVLYLPASLPAPAVVIVSGTSGREGFQNWEIPWAERLQRAGYVALFEDSFTPRHLAFSQHWRLSAAARGRDALDAAAYLARAPFVRAGLVGGIGRSGGGSALLSAVVERAGQTRRLPLQMAVADYGYCQRPYGDWTGGTAMTRGANAVYRATVPLLILVGTNDTHVLAAACNSLALHALKAGAPVTLRTYPGAEHAFDTLYGDGTPAQQADVVNTIAGFIAEYLAPAPSGGPIHVTAAAFESHLSRNGGTIVVSMRGRGPHSVGGTAVLTQSAQNVAVRLNLSESASHAVAEIRQGSCALLYPEVAYRVGEVVNGAASGLVRNVQLAYLMNGHFAIVVGPSEAADAVSSCADIPRNS